MSMERVMRIDQWLSKIEIIYSKKIAIIFKEKKWTYSKLNKLINETASYLQNTCKVNIGDRFCYYGQNDPEQIILLFAASKIGAIIFPINWRLANPEIEYQIKNSKPKLIFFDARFEKNLSNINLDKDIKTVPVNGFIEFNKPLSERRKNKSKLESLERSDLPLLLVYSSGTTGKPKGALLTQKSIIANAKMSHNAHSLQAYDKSLIFLPLFHVGGINILFLPSLFVGATSILQEKFEVELTVENIEKYKITQILTVPTILDQIISHKRWQTIDRNSIKAISIGSTSVPLTLIKNLHACKIPIIQIYGATETGPIAIYQKIKDAFDTEGSIGKVGIHCKVKLVDDNLKEVETGSPGQILVKGDNILNCYWEDAKSTKESIVNGWFLTGDIAKVDNQGNYWFIDRIKNVIISGGENIYPAELEIILKGNKFIKEFSIVGRKDLVWGEVPVIIAVKTTKKIKKEKILQTFEGQVAKYKVPKDIIFVDNLPKNALGKIMVDEVKKLVQ